jgi:hypothetical protein
LMHCSVHPYSLGAGTPIDIVSGGCERRREGPILPAG